jgi:hypothetical protein
MRNAGRVRITLNAKARWARIALKTDAGMRLRGRLERLKFHLGGAFFLLRISTFSQKMLDF